MNLLSAIFVLAVVHLSQAIFPSFSSNSTITATLTPSTTTAFFFSPGITLLSPFFPTPTGSFTPAVAFSNSIIGCWMYPDYPDYSFLGYIVSTYSDRGLFTKRYTGGVSYIPDNVLRFSASSGSRQNLVYSNKPDPFTHAGAVTGYQSLQSFESATGVSYALLVGADAVPAGGHPSTTAAHGGVVGTFMGDLTSTETAIWTIDSLGYMTPNWINPDGTTTPCIAFFDSKLDFLGITSSISSMVNRYRADNILPVYMRIVQT